MIASRCRQSVHYCVEEEEWRRNGKHWPPPEIRTLLPKLLDQYKLLGRPPGQRKAEDAWVERLADTIYGGSSDRAADTVAAALAEGISPEDIGEAFSLAANRLVLCDPGRQQADGDEKPVGSVHGSSPCVHASDAANAWRNIARVSDVRNTFAMVGAYHTAGQSGGFNKQPQPLPEQLEKIKAKDADTLLRDAEAAIKERDQPGPR